jgi:L-asparaginase
MKIIIHGGLLDGAMPQEMAQKRKALSEIVKSTYAACKDCSSTEAVIYAIKLLEDNPLFNAGTGSKIQQDGIIRMSASLMNGQKQSFSGVINIEQVKNPIEIAAMLQEETDKVLSGRGAVTFAMEHGIESYSVETKKRREDFDRHIASKNTGTVGIVAIDKNGTITAGTSTGGKGMEFSGRVSDSATVAGNYANNYCGVSCTGIGEDIVNNATAARIVIRVTDGMPLKQAVEITIDELRQQQGEAGIIAVDNLGNIHYGYSQAEAPLSFALYDGKNIKTF